LNTPLHYACASGNETIAIVLLNSGANVNAKTNDGWTPLLKAVKSKQIEIVKQLIHFHADPNVIINNPSSPYDKKSAKDIAKENGSMDIIDILESNNQKQNTNENNYKESEKKNKRKRFY